MGTVVEQIVAGRGCSTWSAALRIQLHSDFRFATQLMHPAPSIIVFTTLSGLGYGLAAVLGLGLLDPSVTATKVAYVACSGPDLRRSAVLDTCISAIRSAPGGRFRNGGRVGCRARA